MPYFELIGKDTNLVQLTQLDEFRHLIWKHLFDVEDLSTLFDMHDAEAAIPIIDAAVLRLNQNSEWFRQLLDPKDILGLRGNRMALESMRKFLAQNGGTVSGLIP